MSNIIPIDQASRAISPLMRERMAAGKGVNANFQEGIRDAFPVLSIKGKVFRARISGQETPFIDPNTRQPIAFLDLVMVNASRTLAKTYYVKGFTEGDMNPPDCWSLDSVRPDPSVAQKVSPVCQTCPMNAFGSRMTEAGKAAKACQDARRVAIVMPHQINDQQPMVLMLRVPQSSLKNLKAYAQLLERHGMDPGGVITRIAFDYQEAFPKLLFNFVAPLPEAEYRKVIDMADGDMVTGMLLTPDFENAPSTAPVQQDNKLVGAVQQTAPVLDPHGITSEGIIVPQQTQQTAPVADTIELPDGRLFNTKTNTFVEKPKPVEVVPEVQLIELPDGKLFNPVTKQFVEREQPPVQMPTLDPNVITLPDGKFFNQATRSFVTGPEIGAKAVEADAAPVARKRASRKKNETPAAGDPQNTQAAGGQAVEDAGETGDPAGDAATHTNGAADGVNPVVQATSAPLSEVLSKLLPPTTQQ